MAARLTVAVSARNRNGPNEIAVYPTPSSHFSSDPVSPPAVETRTPLAAPRSAALPPHPAAALPPGPPPPPPRPPLPPPAPPPSARAGPPPLDRGQAQRRDGAAAVGRLDRLARAGAAHA